MACEHPTNTLSQENNENSLQEDSSNKTSPSLPSPEPSSFNYSCLVGSYNSSKFSFFKNLEYRIEINGDINESEDFELIILISNQKSEEQLCTIYQNPIFSGEIGSKIQTLSASKTLSYGNIKNFQSLSDIQITSDCKINEFDIIHQSWLDPNIPIEPTLFTEEEPSSYEELKKTCLSLSSIE